MSGSEKHLSFTSAWDLYRFLLDTVTYALYHALYGFKVVSSWLVISKPHHPPPFHIGVPMHLNDPVLELFPRYFHPTNSDERRQVSSGQKKHR